jgi:hypothetical protein
VAAFKSRLLTTNAHERTNVKILFKSSLEFGLTGLLMINDLLLMVYSSPRHIRQCNVTCCAY